MSEFEFYNCNYEMGYYAKYFVESEVLKMREVIMIFLLCIAVYALVMQMAENILLILPKKKAVIKRRKF